MHAFAATVKPTSTIHRCVSSRSRRSATSPADCINGCYSSEDHLSHKCSVSPAQMRPGFWATLWLALVAVAAMLGGSGLAVVFAALWLYSISSGGVPQPCHNTTSTAS